MVVDLKIKLFRGLKEMVLANLSLKFRKCLSLSTKYTSTFNVTLKLLRLASSEPSTVVTSVQSLALHFQDCFLPHLSDLVFLNVIFKCLLFAVYLLDKYFPFT